MFNVNYEMILKKLSHTTAPNFDKVIRSFIFHLRLVYFGNYVFPVNLAYTSVNYFDSFTFSLYSHFHIYAVNEYECSQKLSKESTEKDKLYKQKAHTVPKVCSLQVKI